MTDEERQQKQFSDNLDRMLAGKPAQPDPAMPDDMRSAQEFSQRMIDLRVSPSREFQEQLHKLARKLDATTPAPAWYHRLWPRGVRWQAGLALAALLLVAFIGVRVLLAPGGPAPAPGTKLAITANPSEQAYRIGQTVAINVTLKNVTAEPFKIDQFPPNLSLMQDSTRQAVYTFTAGKTSQTLQPGQSATFRLTWDQIDDKGRQAPVGAYYVELEDLEYQGQYLKMDLTQPARFEIRA